MCLLLSKEPPLWLGQQEEFGISLILPVPMPWITAILSVCPDSSPPLRTTLKAHSLGVLSCWACPQAHTLKRPSSRSGKPCSPTLRAYSVHHCAPHSVCPKIASPLGSWIHTCHQVMCTFITSGLRAFFLQINGSSASRSPSPIPQSASPRTMNRFHGTVALTSYCYSLGIVPWGDPSCLGSSLSPFLPKYFNQSISKLHFDLCWAYSPFLFFFMESVLAPLAYSI